MIIREQFESEYIMRHLIAMPYSEAKQSLESLRNELHYDDDHVNACWYFYVGGFESGANNYDRKLNHEFNDRPKWESSS